MSPPPFFSASRGKENDCCSVSPMAFRIDQRMGFRAGNWRDMRRSIWISSEGVFDAKNRFQVIQRRSLPISALTTATRTENQGTNNYFGTSSVIIIPPQIWYSKLQLLFELDGTWYVGGKKELKAYNDSLISSLLAFLSRTRSLLYQAESFSVDSLRNSQWSKSHCWSNSSK